MFFFPFLCSFYCLYLRIYAPWQLGEETGFIRLCDAIVDCLIVYIVLEYHISFRQWGSFLNWKNITNQVFFRLKKYVFFLEKENSLNAVRSKLTIGTRGGYYLVGLFFFSPVCFCPLFFHALCPFLKWLEHDSHCACFFVFYFFSLSLVPLTRSY